MNYRQSLKSKEKEKNTQCENVVAIYQKKETDLYKGKVSWSNTDDEQDAAVWIRKVKLLLEQLQHLKALTCLLFEQI